ncbi:MAG: DUF2341 domain-containing protein, partial [Desulfobacterales bacterium]
MQQIFNHKASHNTTRTRARLIGLWAVMGWMVRCLPQLLRKTIRSGHHRWTLTDYLRRVMVGLTIIFAITALSTTAQAGIIYFDVGSQTSQTSGTTLAVTVPAAGVTAGNSIIVCFAMGDVTGTVNASDSASNSYSVDIDQVNNNNVRTVILSSHDVSALSSGDTITVTTQNSATNRAMTVAEFSGLSKTAPVLDQSKSNSGFSTSMTTTQTQSTTVTHDLLIGAFGTNGPVSDTFTPDATNGWSLLDRDGTSSGTNDITISSEYKTVTSSGTYSADATYLPKPRYAAGIVAYKGLAATVDQAHYRWRNDDGTESTASWYADEDTKANIGVGIVQRLRFLVENEGAFSAGEMAFKLQVNETATCSSAGYSDVPTDASGDWQIVASQLVDGAATSSAVTGLTDPAGYTWVDGEQEDDSNTTDSITLGIDRFTEIEFSIQPTGNATYGGDYCFRLYDNTGSAPLDKYSAYAKADVRCRYEYRRLLTIDKDQVGVDNNPGTLSDVPVLVSLSGDWLKTTAVDAVNGRIENANGWDIVFRHNDGGCGAGTACVQLDHEIEKYDGTNGELIAWVSIPSVSKSADTDFYIYYGNICVDEDPQNATGVWDTANGWRGVWHLHESSGNATDSTTYASSGTLSGTVTQDSTGQIDGGYYFGSDGKV